MNANKSVKIFPAALLIAIATGAFSAHATLLPTEQLPRRILPGLFPGHNLTCNEIKRLTGRACNALSCEERARLTGRPAYGITGVCGCSIPLKLPRHWLPRVPGLRALC